MHMPLHYRIAHLPFLDSAVTRCPPCPSPYRSHAFEFFCSNLKSPLSLLATFFLQLSVRTATENTDGKNAYMLPLPSSPHLQVGLHLQIGLQSQVVFLQGTVLGDLGGDSPGLWQGQFRSRPVSREVEWQHSRGRTGFFGSRFGVQQVSCTICVLGGRLGRENAGIASGTRHG
jgi:hypothetical protein